MGIFCKISLHKPLNYVYRPGDLISGEIIYAVDKETALKAVTLSLIGKAYCEWTETNGKVTRYYSGTEKLYAIHTNVLENSENGTNVPVDSYNVPFNFILPHNIPSTYIMDGNGYVKHVVRIKFDVVGLLNITVSKKFYADVSVIGNVEKCEPHGPVVYGNKKQLTELFTSKKKIINIKATIHKTLINSGSEIELDCETDNDTSLTMSAVKIQLVRKNTYTSDDENTLVLCKKIQECKSKSEPLEPYSNGKFSPTIKVPHEIHTIQHSRVFKREYYILITGKLPMPHRNITLEIPVIIEDTSHETGGSSAYNELEYSHGHSSDKPPSYWEVMKDENKMKH